MAAMRKTYSLFDNKITLHCSDGNPRLRPDPTEDINTPQFIDCMEECHGDNSTLRFWKKKIGSFLAKHVLHCPGSKDRQFTLTSLPAGYTLYVHKKGERHDYRRDAYLWGCGADHVFRSPAEFFLHAKWILAGCPAPLSHDEKLWGKAIPEDFESQCECKYCGKTDQGVISRKYSNYTPAGRGRRRVAG